MSFWSDASPIVKGVVVAGGIGIIILGWMALGIAPFDAGVDTSAQVRGVDVTQQVQAGAEE